jgi:endonuclease YncB( thermonuclease family)
MAKPYKTRRRVGCGRKTLPGSALRISYLVLAALAPCLALADFAGRVVKVADGDSLTVLVNKQRIRVRLDGIDAPEQGQPFGKRSRQSLSDMCAAKTAVVVDRGKDQYGRTIGRVSCAGADANSEQLQRGMAWVFTQYVPRGSPFYELEASARVRQLGLWADARPIAPWTWRAANARREWRSRALKRWTLRV